jgi:hypothetical protein
MFGKAGSAVRGPFTDGCTGWNEEAVVGSKQQLAGAGNTAPEVAMVRARETDRADRLFDDPYAQAFLTAAPPAFPEERQIRHAGRPATAATPITAPG